jgi:outer membrane autotransporter protein
MGIVKTRRALRGTLLATTALTVAAIAAAPAYAADWTAGTGDWHAGANWTGGIAPRWSDFAIINNGGTALIHSGIADSGVVYLGQGASHSGRVEVDGAGTEWRNFGAHIVGNSGHGSMAVTNGAKVSSMFGEIAANAGSSGAVTVDGAGSAWNNDYELYVGYSGSATLAVTGGGAVSAWSGSIGALQGSGTVTISGAGSIWTNSDGLYVGEGGTGTLEVAAGGRVTSATGYIGFGTASTGNVTVTGENSLWTNSSQLRLGSSGNGMLTIADGGTVKTGTLSIAHNASATGTLNIGAASGEAAAWAGMLDVAALTFGAGAGTLVFNHREEDYLFGTGMSGAGTIRHEAGVTRLTGNSSAFAGTAFLDGGFLIVDGELGGAMNVGAGRLGGSGIVGTTTVGAGGSIAPGNSVGTLNVAGDIVFEAGSFLDVDADASGNADLLTVNGTAFLDGGTVRVSPASGNYAANTQYTILSANAVSGVFGGVTSGFAFLAPTLSYDAQNVFLTLDLAAGFQDVAKTKNQIGIAGAAESLGMGNAIFDEILFMTEEEARDAFNSLSGEMHGSAATAGFQSAQQIRAALLARLQMFSGGVQLARADHAPASGDAVPGDGPSVWGQLFGNWGTNDANANVARLSRRSAGFIGGIDKPVGEASRIGLALGYSRSHFSVDARASSGDADNFHAAAYGSTKLGAVDLAGTLAYGYGRAETARRVVVGGLTDDLAARYDSHTLQASVEAGRDFKAGTVTLTPFAALTGTHVETEGFTETGGPSALTFGASSNTTGVTTLGLRARHEAGSLALSGSAAWRRAFGDTDPASRAAFTSAPTASFTVQGTPVAKDTLALDTGIEARLGTATTLTLGYAGELGSDARDHGLRAELRIGF